MLKGYKVSEQENVAERFPIDYDKIEKGSIIGSDRIEAMMKVKKDDVKRYQLAMLSAKERITKDLWRIGKHYHLRQRGEDLVVLTDLESSSYCKRSAHSKLLQYANIHAHTMAVDAGRLTEPERKEHERTIEVQSKYLLAMKDVRKKLIASDYKRSTPTMLE